MKEQSHIKRIMERTQLEEIALRKYQDIWRHSSIPKIIEAYQQLSSISVSLEERGIKYSKDLKSALKFSPFEDPDLCLEPETFRKMLKKTDIRNVRRVNENFDLILMWLDDGFLLKAIREFIADYSYKLANFNKKGSKYGYDPEYHVTGQRNQYCTRSTKNDA